jgi:hypothetical protein
MFLKEINSGGTIYALKCVNANMWLGTSESLQIRNATVLLPLFTFETSLPQRTDQRTDVLLPRTLLTREPLHQSADLVKSLPGPVYALAHVGNTVWTTGEDKISIWNIDVRDPSPRISHIAYIH